MMRVTTSEGDHIDTVIDKKGDSETQVKSGKIVICAKNENVGGQKMCWGWVGVKGTSL